MFRCDHCDKSTKPGEGMTRVIVQTRKKLYTNAKNEVIGVGTEIVKELRIGPCCRGNQ